jgi:hypothetical protein
VARWSVRICIVGALGLILAALPLLNAPHDTPDPSDVDAPVPAPRPSSGGAEAPSAAIAALRGSLDGLRRDIWEFLAAGAVKPEPISSRLVALHGELMRAPDREAALLEVLSWVSRKSEPVILRASCAMLAGGFYHPSVRSKLAELAGDRDPIVCLFAAYAVAMKPVKETEPSGELWDYYDPPRWANMKEHPRYWETGVLFVLADLDAFPGEDYCSTLHEKYRPRFMFGASPFFGTMQFPLEAGVARENLKSRYRSGIESSMLNFRMLRVLVGGGSEPPDDMVPLLEQSAWNSNLNADARIEAISCLDRDPFKWGTEQDIQLQLLRVEDDFDVRHYLIQHATNKDEILFSDPQIAARIESHWMDLHEPGREERAEEFLGRFGRINSPKALALLHRIAKTEANPSFRLAAVRSLGERNDREEAVRAQIEYLREIGGSASGEEAARAAIGFGDAVQGRKFFSAEEASALREEAVALLSRVHADPALTDSARQAVSRLLESLTVR